MRPLLRQYGHDAVTVFEEGLRGEPDTDLANVCRQEGRAIVTLDLDLANIRDFPPGDYDGIIVLRLNDQSRASLLQVLRRIFPLFDTEPLVGRLWIVDEHRIRIRQ